ncbi:Bcr/CflA family efflux MFS transporter [Mesobaculum littorinae]|uniref:Bcr/CflA family efflux transporter n=1 Tax=Mesobaculum littorinae TaxID=2486419 RepID=A0A438ALH8_9RHOB|nr:multidrug effflux MFS transporter [Mesobaculum littorinae]RVV99396.1 Bcr/CflA family efflux MFS transporter [Mesobaculum littorinae]
MVEALSPPRPRSRFLDRTTPPHIATLIILASVSALAMNIFVPSLPRMAQYFDTDYSVIQLSVALYLAGNAVLQILLGPISDRYGRRPVILAALVIFVLATLGCILAPTVEVFLSFRVLQSVVIACLALSRAAVRDMVPAEQAASMIGYVTMGMSVAPMVAPAIGGVLEGLAGWRATFALLAVLGCGALWLTWRDMGETAQPRDISLRDQIGEYPELLRSPRFWGYCAVSALSSGAFFAYVGGAPFVGATIFHLTPTALGILFGAPAVGYMLGNFLSGQFSMRLGINTMVLSGTLCTALGTTVSLAITLAGADSPLSFFGLMTLVGLGNGLVLPNATSGMLSVRPHLAGTASGLGGAFMIGGGAILSAYAGTLLNPSSGAAPLLWIMAITSVLAIVAIVLTIRREARLHGRA